MKQTEIFNKKAFYIRTPVGKGWEKKTGTIVYFVTDDDLRIVLGLDKRGKYYHVTDIRTGLSLVHEGIRRYTNSKILIYTLSTDDIMFNLFRLSINSKWYEHSVNIFTNEIPRIDPDFYNDIEGLLFPYYKI